MDNHEEALGTGTMNLTLLDSLCCPLCRTPLQLTATPTNTQVETGQLRCAQGHHFAIEAGIPQLISAQLPGYAAKMREAQGWVAMAQAEGWYEASATVDLALPDVVGQLGWDPTAASIWVGTHYSFNHLLTHYVQSGMRVLEVGAAKTWAGRYFVAAGCAYTGCDLVTDPQIGLGRARFYMAQAGIDYHVVAGDAEALPFADGTFDLVFGVAALHHALDLKRMVSEMARVARPGGIVAGLNEGIRSFLAAPEAASQAKEKGYGINEHVYTLWDYYRAFQQADLRVSKLMRATEPTYLLPPRWKQLLQTIGQLPLIGEAVGASLLVGLLHAYDGLTIYGRKRR